MVGLLDEILSALTEAGSTPWAQEMQRAGYSGANMQPIDEASTPRRSRQRAAPVTTPRQAPPPSADVRNPGNSADPFQAGDARVATSSDTDARAPSDVGIFGAFAPVQIAASGAQTAPPPPVAAPARPVAPAASQAAPAQRSAPAPYQPDFSEGLAPLAKFIGLDKLGLDGGEKARVQRLAYDALVARGEDPRSAELMARQPQLLAQYVAKNVGGDHAININGRLVDKRNGRLIADYSDTSRQGPEIKTVEMPDGTKLSVVWDAKQGRHVPISMPDAAASAPAAPAQSGVPAIPAPPPGVNPQKWREKMTNETAESVAKAQAALPEVERATEKILRNLDDLAKDPSLDAVVGPLDKWTPTILPGSNRALARINEVQGQAFLSAFNVLKGAGAITEKEGEKATGALNRLSERGVSESDYRAAIKEFRDEVVRLAGVARQRAGLPVAPAAAAAAPDQGNDPLGLRK